MDNISIQNVTSMIWLGPFRYNCTRGQLNNEERGELHNIKRSQDKTKVDKEILWWRVNKYLLKPPRMRLWGYCIYTEMCFNNKYRYRTLQRGC